MNTVNTVVVKEISILSIIAHIVFKTMTKMSETCLRCGNKMDKLTTCHLRCSKCGMEMDCSDKGCVWG